MKTKWHALVHVYPHDDAEGVKIEPIYSADSIKINVTRIILQKKTKRG